MSHFPVVIKDGYLVNLYDRSNGENKLMLVGIDKHDRIALTDGITWTLLAYYDNEELTSPITKKELTAIYGRAFGVNMFAIDTLSRDLLWHKVDENESDEDDLNLDDCKTFTEVIEKGTKYFEKNTDMSHEEAERTVKSLSTLGLLMALMGLDDLNK